jgi:DNA polymerase-4
MLVILEDIAAKLENALARREAQGRTITLKIKYFDFKSITRSVTVSEPADTATEIMRHVKPLLAKTEAGKKKVRLLGISISNFRERQSRVGMDGQLLLPFKFNSDVSGKQPF